MHNITYSDVLNPSLKFLGISASNIFCLSGYILNALHLTGWMSGFTKIVCVHKCVRPWRSLKIFLNLDNNLSKSVFWISVTSVEQSWLSSVRESSPKGVSRVLNQKGGLLCSVGKSVNDLISAAVSMISVNDCLFQSF